ncbi:hypothetical protein BTUL_0035g00530 [Botrytis tulipae]|uniref:Uncharacterized protein n=1 Tax=Botrytis tulipae TaxID=87230 RepID=A0A4Z1EXI5_9HELO|nr:hypothetical protein BTUL_0035g00530 [Botrytis tulipae]
MKHQSSTSTASPISLSPDVERRIEDPEVRRVLLLFIELGQADIIECLNKKVKQDPEEFEKILEAVCLYVRRGSVTQSYLTKLMSTDKDPFDWKCDPEEDKSITPVERQLINKFGTRWPTVRGAIDMCVYFLRHSVQIGSWKVHRPDLTYLTYRVWLKVTICPNEHPWDQKSAGTESQNFRGNLRLQVVMFYPGLVNLAFLSQNQFDELRKHETAFDGKWTEKPAFRNGIMRLLHDAIRLYGVVDDRYTYYDRSLPGRKLTDNRYNMLDDFEAHKDAVLNCHADSFQKFSHVSGWYKCDKLWVPGNPLGSVLNMSKMMVREEFVKSRNLMEGCDEDCAAKAVRKYGIGYVPRPLSEIPLEDAEKDKRGITRQTSRIPPKQESPSQNSQHRGISQTRTGSHGKQQKQQQQNQQQGKSDKRAESRPLAKKLDSGDKVKAHPPGPSLRKAEPRQSVEKKAEATQAAKKSDSSDHSKADPPRHSLRRAEPLQSVERRPEAKKSSKKPDPQVVPSSSRTGGSGATPRRHG